VVLITIGITLATLSAPPKPGAAPRSPTDPAQASIAATPARLSDSTQYALGIAMLTVALVISSLMGLWQEGTYKRYGAVWQEGLFYSVSLIDVRGEGSLILLGL
jgi:UDP-xylose/UDP-N-acetylglucosamine transporter B4